MAFTATDPIKIIFAILLPPLGTFLEVGFKGHFWLNILLTLFGFIPRHHSRAVCHSQVLTR